MPDSPEVPFPSGDAVPPTWPATDWATVSQPIDQATLEAFMRDYVNGATPPFPVESVPEVQPAPSLPIDLNNLEWHSDMDAYWDATNEQWVTQAVINSMQQTGGVNTPVEDRDAWATLELPEGIVFLAQPNAYSRYGHIRLTASNYEDFRQKMQALRSHLTLNNLCVRTYRKRHAWDGARQFPSEFLIMPFTGIVHGYSRLEPTDCILAGCDGIVGPGEVNCNQHHMQGACSECLQLGMGLVPWVDYQGEPNGMYLCLCCVGPCEEPECMNLGANNSDWMCFEHRFQWCYACDTGIRGTEIHEHNGRAYCEYCASRICENCGSSEYNAEDHTINPDTGISSCPNCYRGEPRWNPVTNNRIARGQTELDDDEADAELAIPPIPGREVIRRAGVEIEGAGSGDALAYALARAGLSAYDRMLGYHTRTRGAADEDSYTVELDSSVDWELVSPVILPNDPTSVARLNGALDVIRELHKQKAVGFDTRCGLHIHVEAMPTNATGAFNLGVLWNHLEDTIFRLGAAKWPMHRSLYEGSRYATPLPKTFTNPREFGRQVGDNPDRYNALSFANFFSQLFNRCSCGAVRYDDWSNCECDLGKCTFEFRVFNTTANKVKMHAYLALCQALVAKAVTTEEPLSSGDLPADEFYTHSWDAMVSVTKGARKKAWKRGLEFIFNDLPLTDKERGSLLYCVRHSELVNTGAEFIDSLIPTPDIQEVTA